MNDRNWKKAILHLDIDAFYPAVEVLDNPELKGKAVIVGGPKARGVVSSASYEARTFGVHSAQPMATAMRLCPKGVFLPVRMARYKEVSDQVFKVFHHFTPLVEPVSIDEAFLDVTGSTRLFGEPEDIAATIKKMVQEEIGLTISAGLAPSKFVAKIASDLEKPDGLTVVLPEQVQAFLDPLPIDKMWGVGKQTQKRLHDLGVRTIGDLGRFSAEVLEKKFGKQGTKMHQLALGIDERDVVPGSEIKSIGHEETFSQDILKREPARKEILYLAQKVARRMRRKGVSGKTITLKVKYKDFVQVTRSVTVPALTCDGHTIFTTACGLMEKTDVGKKPVRLLGVSVSHLSHGSASTEQLSLFQQEETSSKRKNLNTALDSVSDKFGEDALLPATLLTEDGSRS
ncbi:MAG: DNA polymerase IV [Thermodesulfobacteriota bacterium]|nr:DNA polymerase IV [Thermodesulfobacteriota bacterium]